jgi:VWFA-related protein
MFLIPLLVSLVSAQPAEIIPTFKSGVANVRIDVQATQDNQLITDLTKDDFQVSDEGVQQNIVYFAREAETLSIVLLLDVSGSMREYIEQMAAVARQALRFLRLRDRVSVMIFAKDQRVHLEWTETKVDVADALRTAVYDDSLGAGTNINDALLAAAKHIELTAGETGRRAVLVVSDNVGLNYRSPDQPVIDAMTAEDTVLNGIIVGKGQRPDRTVSGGTYRNPDFSTPDIFFISEQTGGEAVKAAQAGNAFSTMIERIRNRYSLHYNIPKGAKVGSFRKVSVELTPAARLRYPHAELRHRKGYRVQE